MPVILRSPSPEISQCELTFLPRQAIDFERLAEQHTTLVRELARCGLELIVLPSLPGAADAIFVEDTAVITPELAVICRPGAASRRQETESIAQVLAEYRPLKELSAEARLDGGDVLQIGRRIFIGLSQRSNSEAVAEIRALLTPLGYEIIAVPVPNSLHLKTAVTALDEKTLLLNPDWVDARLFSLDYQIIQVDPQESFAANCLRLEGLLFYSTAHPQTLLRLQKRGYHPHLITIDEIEKAEAGLTCCCIAVE